MRVRVSQGGDECESVRWRESSGIRNYFFRFAFESLTQTVLSAFLFTVVGEGSTCVVVMVMVIAGGNGDGDGDRRW